MPAVDQRKYACIQLCKRVTVQPNVEHESLDAPMNNASSLRMTDACQHSQQSMAITSTDMLAISAVEAPWPSP